MEFRRIGPWRPPPASRAPAATSCTVPPARSSGRRWTWPGVNVFCDRRYREVVRENRRCSWKPGVDAMITSFCDFCQFSAKKLAFSQIPMLWPKFLHNLALLWVKNANFFRWIFRRKYWKNHNIGPSMIIFSCVNCCIMLWWVFVHFFVKIANFLKCDSWRNYFIYHYNGLRVYLLFFFLCGPPKVPRCRRSFR
jgi:hypothetical protein